MRFWLSALAMLAGLLAMPTQAATISIVSMHYSATHPVPHLHYDGDTVPGDLDLLRDMYNTFVNCREACSGPDGMPTAVLSMNGPGGSYGEGLAIADFLRENHIATVVERDAYCYSACAFAFLGGSSWSSQEGVGTYIDRMVEPGSTVGFHAPYKDEDSFRAALEERGAMAAQGDTRDALSLMVKELVKWNVDPEVIFKMVGMGPDETYNLRTAEDLYLARVNLPPTPTAGWITDLPDAIRNVCMRLIAIDERGDPADSWWRFLSEYTPNIGVSEYAGPISGYKLGDRLLDIGSCAAPEKSLATDGDYEVSLYYTPGIDGVNGVSTSLFNRQHAWSTAGAGRIPSRRIFARGPLNSYFLPLGSDLDSLDLPGEQDIDRNRFNLKLPPLLANIPSDLTIDASDPTSRVSHWGNVYVFERVGPAGLFDSALAAGQYGRTYARNEMSEGSFLRSGTFDDTGNSFAWFGLSDGTQSTVVEAIILPEYAGAAPTMEETEFIERLECDLSFVGRSATC